jgi:hypothetical protein
MGRLKINIQAIRDNMIKTGSEKSLNTLNDIRGLITVSLRDCDPVAFSIHDQTGEIVLNSDWEKELRVKFTVIPESENQIRFAELVNEFQKNYNDLKSLLPGSTPVFGNEHDAIKPLFRMKGQSISFIEFSLLQRVKP